MLYLELTIALQSWVGVEFRVSVWWIRDYGGNRLPSQGPISPSSLPLAGPMWADPAKRLWGHPQSHVAGVLHTSSLPFSWDAENSRAVILKFEYASESTGRLCKQHFWAPSPELFFCRSVWDLSICTSYKFPNVADAASLGTLGQHPSEIRVMLYTPLGIF